MWISIWCFNAHILVDFYVDFHLVVDSQDYLCPSPRSSHMFLVFNKIHFTFLTVVG